MLAAEELSLALTLLLVTPSLCISRPSAACDAVAGGTQWYSLLPEGLLSVGDSLLGVVPVPARAPHSLAPGSPAVPQSSTVKVSSKLFLPKGGSLVGAGRTERKEARQQQAPPPGAHKEGKGTRRQTRVLLPMEVRPRENLLGTPPSWLLEKFKAA